MTKLEELLTHITELEKTRKFPAALELAQGGLREFATDKALMFKLGKLLEINKQYKGAVSVYKALNEATLKEGKSDLVVMVGLANCLFQDGSSEEAENLLLQLAKKVPKQPDVLALLSAVKRKAGNKQQAELLAKNALKADPANKVATYELAQLALDAKQADVAIQLLEKNINRHDVHGESIDLWMSTLEKSSRTRYAQDKLEELAKAYPDIIEFSYAFAVLANKAGEITLARPAYEKALAISPENPRVNYELGVLERIAGNLELSQELIAKALELQPDNPAALRTYLSETKLAYGDENFKKLNYVAARFTEFSSLEQIHLHYALAKAYEDVGELDTAFRHYEVAGRKKRKTLEFSERDAVKMSQVIPKVVTPANLAKSNWKGCESDVPVFILGMPRSGTSLMEQVLSAHPDIFGAGELKFMTGVLENIQLFEGTRLRMGDKDPVFPYEENASWEQRGQKYVERVQKLADKPYQRIVDKMPGNYNFVGLIHSILPNAKIIHSRRHPVETCLSCYRIHFAEGHQWTYNLRELGRAYKRYWNLMQYWREAFPGVMLEVKYEENVANLEAQARKLIDHLGLEWNERCLEFYNVDRPVKTASVTQVRKPIYTTSTNRWRKYEKYLGPLLEELGDIVPQYEAEIAHLS